MVVELSLAVFEITEHTLSLSGEIHDLKIRIVVGVHVGSLIIDFLDLENGSEISDVPDLEFSLEFFIESAGENLGEITHPSKLEWL